MTRNDIKRRTKDAIQKLNTMGNRVKFNLNETSDSISLECCSRGDEKYHFGTYEKKAYFDDFRKKTNAYLTVMEFAEVIIAATKLNDERAFHNFV